MDVHKKKQLKEKILKRYELHKLQHSRLKRALRDPFRTIPYYFMQLIAHVIPFKVTYKTLWGDTMTFYLPEGNAIYYYGFFEANLTNFFLNFFKEGDVFIDIGAHVGFYSLLVSRLVGDSGKVYSFEPTPRTFISLKENTASSKNTTIDNRALLNEEKEIEFSDYGPKFSIFNSFKKRTSEEMSFLSKPEIIHVKTITLDTYCKQHGILPTFIKIDAEGSEHLILSGMRDILAHAKPLISIEVSGGIEWAENCKKSIDTLEGVEYIGFEINNAGYLKKYEKKELYEYDNLIFVHRDKIEGLKNLLLQ